MGIQGKMIQSGNPGSRIRGGIQSRKWKMKMKSPSEELDRGEEQAISLNLYSPFGLTRSISTVTAIHPIQSCPFLSSWITLYTDGKLSPGQNPGNPVREMGNPLGNVVQGQCHSLMDLRERGKESTNLHVECCERPLSLLGRWWPSPVSSFVGYARAS